jgi:hypothetical protein
MNFNFINTLRFSLLALIFVTHAASSEIINIAGTATVYESMGQSVAAGNFDCDAYDDLAIGSDREINILYGGTGSANKLGTPGNFQFTLASLGSVSNIQTGVALAAGDFDGNGCDDLAVGVPDASVGSVESAGAVYVLYGNGNGLNAGAPQVFNQNVTSIADVAESTDDFGHALAVGDFNGDNHDDLAIGVPDELPGGAVHVLHGQPWAGLGAVTSRFYTQDSPGIEGGPETHDYFGFALAAGDFDNNGYDDLAIGVPGEAIHSLDRAGIVHVLYSTSSSLSTSGSQLWQQGAGGLLGTQGAQENFGYSLASGNFDNWEGDDLAIGVPFEGYNTGTGSHVGGVHVLYGEQNVGLDSQWNQLFRADDAGIPVNNAYSYFGWFLTVGNFNNDDFADLAIDAPKDAVPPNVGHAGGVYVLYGAGIFSASNGEYLHQNTTGADGDAESYDDFGEGLASGDFDGNGSSDLVVGVPVEEYNGVTSVGVVQVFYGQGVNGLITSQGVVDDIFAQ